MELIRTYAAEKSILVTFFKPDREKYQASALMQVHLWVIQSADIVVVFWNGKSQSTKTLIQIAFAMDKDVDIENI